MKKQFDEDKMIDFLAVVTIIVLVGLIWWLIEWAKPFEIPKTEETTQIVENSVESVEKCVFVPEETQSTYTEKEMTITAYCPCVKCCGKSDGITASGTKATQGRTVAVDPQYIPYGTEVIIDGVTYIAEDCGGAIKGNRIDLFFSSHEQALSFGRQTKKVRIME